ncbi:hypothetical protein UlMin_018749 [Ulmus minor]
MDFEVDVPNCFCGRNLRCFTSWTDSNPGRRFLGCPNFRGEVKCGFFRWYDPPICARSKMVIPGLLRRIQELEMRLRENNGFEGIGRNSTLDSAMEEVNSTNRGNQESRGRNWFGLWILVTGILFLIGKFFS